MGELLVKDKDIVVPGEVLASGMDFLPASGTFREDQEIIASQVGIVTLNGRLIKLVPLNMRYTPKRGDTLIGKVVDIGPNAWYVDVGHFSDAVIPLKEGSMDYIPRGADLSQYYSHGDYVIANVVNVTKSRVVE